uniref:Uncharacterized protein n=1 Tax=Glossina pallidipes TaxID=7398 RepID=A0A1A9ZGH9_GLOPL
MIVKPINILDFKESVSSSFFFDDTATDAVYLHLLQENVMLNVREQFENAKDYYCQQDGAFSHSDIRVYLIENPLNRWMDWNFTEGRNPFLTASRMWSINHLPMCRKDHGRLSTLLLFAQCRKGARNWEEKEYWTGQGDERNDEGISILTPPTFEFGFSSHLI